ncbi:kinase-like domain-containing protein [Phellopilus nigrolimitatus]|nr:kinase-like domain-containing protein [Phellopilus nigrolimitatus]
MRHAQLADKYHSVRQLESFVNANTRSDLPLSYDLRRIVEEAQRVLDLDETVLAQEHRSLLLKLLTKTAKHHGYLPLQLYIKDVTRSGNYPVNGGGFADIWRGESNGSPVALKVLRVFGEPDDPSWKNVHRELCKEAILWRNLKHKNILPFLGLCANEFAPRIAMVSLWMKNGDLRSYLATNPTEDRIQILKGVICGLDYLHGQTPPIVHGDLRGANILFDDEGNSLISDFGLARVAEVHASASGTSSGHAKGSVRWMAPELLLPSLVEGHDGRHTLKSDMYAFAMVCIEVFTGAPPFEGLSDAEVVSTVINQDGRPMRAMGDAFQRGLRMHMWDIIRRCWTKDPSIRPRSKDISVILGAIGPSGAGTQPVSWFMEKFFKIDGITFHSAAEKPRQDLLLSRQRNRTTDGLEKRSDTLSSVPESIAPPRLPGSSLPPEKQHSSGKPITKDTNGPLPANSEVLENFFRSLLSKKLSESVPIVREEAVEIHGTLP